MNNSINNGYALITGASAGIGKALATEFAKKGHNLILVALPDSGLCEVTETLIKNYAIKAWPLTIDLTETDAPQKVRDFCTENELPVNILVNNAGIGHEGLFTASPLPFIVKMLQLNMTALTCLTHLFLAELKRHDNAYILNVGSMASFRPMPYKCVYTATKSYVFYFSRALREELRDSPVRVSVLCPGPVITNAKVEARTNNKGFFSDMMLMKPDEVAEKAVRHLFNNKAVIVPGIVNRALILLEKGMPRSIPVKIIARLFKS